MIELSEHMVGRKYTVACNNGSVLSGECISYIPDKDNEPEIDCIWIEDSNGKIEEVFLPDIKSIERID